MHLPAGSQQLSADVPLMLYSAWHGGASTDVQCSIFGTLLSNIFCTPALTAVTSVALCCRWQLLQNRYISRLFSRKSAFPQLGLCLSQRVAESPWIKEMKGLLSFPNWAKWHQILFLHPYQLSAALAVVYFIFLIFDLRIICRKWPDCLFGDLNAFLVYTWQLLPNDSKWLQG